MKKGILTAVLSILGIGTGIAQTVSMDENKLANSGYDVVNYFTAHSAERGSQEFSATHSGATYYFVNEDNKKSFEENPTSFLPQYDGFCAFAVAKMNKKIPTNPQTFRIDDGKLYLFFNDFYEGKPFNTIIPWVNNEAEMEKMALENWKTLQGS